MDPISSQNRTAPRNSQVCGATKVAANKQAAHGYRNRAFALIPPFAPLELRLVLSSLIHHGQTIALQRLTASQLTGPRRSTIRAE